MRRGERVAEGVISGFRFHSAVVAEGGMGERRLGLWEPCEDKEQRGSPAVCLIAPECIFPLLVIPASSVSTTLARAGTAGRRAR